MRNWNPDYPEVPVDKDGNWMSYPGYGQQAWEPVQRFFATMEIDGMRTGRSSKVIILKDKETGKRYPMFVADLVKGVQTGTLHVNSKSGGQPGEIVAWWTASKRGANYGIKSVEFK